MSSYNQTARLRQLYAAQSRPYPEKPTETPSYPLVQMPEPLYSDSLKRDLNNIIHHASESPPAGGTSLAARVFGGQLGQAKVKAQHLGHLLDERWQLYRRHMDDLQVQISDFKNQLHFARRAPLQHTLQQIVGLERLVTQVEAQQREEQLAFWKDSAELRDRLLESALEYRAARHRAGLLGIPEEESAHG